MKEVQDNEEEKEEEKLDPDNLPGMWEETFKTHLDSKPRGVFLKDSTTMEPSQPTANIRVRVSWQSIGSRSVCGDQLL